MSGPKRTPIQIERDRRDIARLYLQGKLQSEIAEYINSDENRDYTITQQMVSYDLKRVQESWQKSSLLDMNELKARELAKIDNLELEYWAAWKRSQEDAEEVKEVILDEIGMMPVERKRKGQAGDPRFLQGVQWCIERRCKILGIDAPEQVKHSGSISIINNSNINTDEL